MDGNFFEKITDTLKGYYYSAEDKWYHLIDVISDKVPQFGKVVDIIEDKGVPTFPLAITLVLLLIILISFMFVGTGSTLTITVTDPQGNYVQGAVVKIFFEGEEKETRITTVNGEAKFYLTNATYSLNIEKDDYQSLLENITIIGDSELDYKLSPQDIGITKVVRLAKANGELATGSGNLKYSCEDTKESHTTTYSGGVFNATFSTKCETISVESVSGHTIIDGRLSFLGTLDTIEVEEIIIDDGTVIVNFDGNAQPGLKVILKSNDSATELQKYNSSGSVVFEEVPVNTYYVIVTDPTGNYNNYDSKILGEIKELTKDSTITFNVSLEKTNAAQINVLVRDVINNLPLLGASVKLINNGTTMNTQVTGSTGQVSFNIPKETQYTIEVDHPEYIIAQRINVSSSTPNLEINLVKATEQNSQSLVVNIMDSGRQPIDKVKVYLKKIDDTTIGDYKITGASGKTEFFNLDIGTYYVYAVKEGFDGINSASVQVIPRQQSNLEAILPIGNGDIKLTILDSEKNTIGGASVKAIDYYTGVVLDQSTTNNDGTIMFSIRADKSVYFEISMPNYMTYYTAALNPNKNIVTQREIILLRETGALSARIVGIYSDGQEVSSAERSVSEGIYTARILLVVPKGSFSESGLHLRTGSNTPGKTNYMEEDSSYLSTIKTSANLIRRGTTYTPPNGYDVDSKNFTGGNSKWINSIWKNPKEGVYETEVELVITDATPGSSINLWYRAWAKGSSILRYPSDSPQQELYSQTNNYLLSAGATSLCEDSFCKTYSIRTLTGTNAGKTQFITSNFNAKQDNSYSLIFNLTNYSGKTLGESILTLNTAGINVDRITINGVEQEETINLGSLVGDSFTQGTIEFTTTSAGTGSIGIVINSATKTEMEDTITLNIQGNKTMNVDFIPKQIIPYIKNTLIFDVTDNNNPLSDAIVSVFSNETIIGTVNTNAEGLAVYELASPTAGETIKITVEKEGYNINTIEKVVDKEIINIVPPQIIETIKIGELVSIEEQIVLENWTVKDLVIKSIDFSEDLGTYLNLTTNDTIGKTIKSNQDFNFILTIKLNNTGKNIVEPRTVEGFMIVDVYVDETKSSFTHKIPVKIRISRPGYIDSGNCLKITPGEVIFITSTNEVSQTLNIKNDCTAEGISISLSDLEAKIDKTALFGTLTVSGTEFNTVQLNETYSTITNFIEQDMEETITIKFNPKITNSTGKQNFVLTFRAKNIPEENEQENITTTINVETTMSKLSECIVIEEPQGGITLDVAGWNLGYNRIINSNMASHMQQYQGFTQQGMYRPQMPYGMQAAMPFMGAGQATGSLAYEEDTFIVKNNCNVEVEIDLDPDSALNVDEKKFIISPNDDRSVKVSPGYRLGRYNIKVNARISQSEEPKEKIDTIKAIVQKLGDVDTDCVKVNVTVLKFNSFLYTEKIYKAYNYCYDTGVQLSRSNNAVTLQCDAPQTIIPKQQSEPYFVVGQEPYYNQSYPTTQFGGMYPQQQIGNMYNSFNDYLNPNNECGKNDCTMIDLIRVRNRSTSLGATGTIETIDFEVRPSATYIQQRKLFDQKTNQYGLFANLASVRDWATQTDARTRVYGELGVQYTNQYGSTQCMTFPVQVEDTWRITESIDSAINWGDPNAHPSECVNENALNLIDFYNKKAPQYKGALPEGEGWIGGIKFIHIAEPPAVRVGPPQTIQTRQPTVKNDSRMTAKANCGYLDTLNGIQLSGPSEIDGVKIKVEGTTTGSVLKNNRGPNLMIEVDRSGMVSDCVIIETSVKAKLRRAINFDSAEVYWPLKIMVIKQGVDPSTINKDACAKTTTQEASEREQCEQKINSELRANKDISYDDLMKKIGQPCPNYFSRTDIEQMKTTAQTTGTCTTNAKSFGFELINKDRINDREAQNKLGDVLDCTRYFCTHDQTQIYLLEQYRNITQKLNTNKNAINCNSNGSKMLSELYKEAKTMNVNTCEGSNVTGKISFFIGENETIVSQPYILDGKKEDKSIPNMLNVLEKITDDSVLVRFKANTGSTTATKYNKMFEDLGAAKDTVGNYYMTVKNYKIMIEKAHTDNCKKVGESCKITSPCVEEVTLINKAFEWLARDGQITIIKAVKENTTNNEEIELVYRANPKLDEIHKLAMFDSEITQTNNDLLLTQIQFSEANAKSFTNWAGQLTLDSGENLLKKFIVDDDYNLEFNNSSVKVGQYKTRIDFNYCDTENKTAKIKTMTKRDKVTDAENAEKNVLLKNGFVIEEISGTNAVITAPTIIDSGGKFYKRVPIKISVSTTAGETALIYNTTAGNPSNLITWRNELGVRVATDQRSAEKIREVNPRANTSYLIANLPKTETAQTYKGIYYYTQGVNLIAASGQKQQTYNATYVGGETGTITPRTISGGTTDNPVIEISTSTIPKLNDIIDKVNAGVACITEDGSSIVWNENELLK
jgi:hypothetical protein